MNTVDLSDDELELVKMFREGRGIACNCDFGLAIRASEQGDGRIKIEVDPTPAIFPTAFALKKFIRETIRQWHDALGDEGGREKP